jgi:16S rRNA (uracil1498-N3)-methyltransferase
VFRPTLTRRQCHIDYARHLDYRQKRVRSASLTYSVEYAGELDAERLPQIRSMADRYFVQDPVTTDRALLTGPEAHHLAHVMRARPGDRVTAFDGGGAEFTAEVLRVGRADVELAILERSEIDRESSIELTLAVSLPKGDRQKWLVEKCTELGVSRIVPLTTARSVAETSPQTASRLARAVVEASKQCGRNRLLEIASPRRWEELVANTTDVPLRLVAHPGGRTPAKEIVAGGEFPRQVLAAVGPEGGFTDDEISLAVADGWRLVNLGPRVLRIETAAVLLAGMVVTSTWGGCAHQNKTSGGP